MIKVFAEGTLDFKMRCLALLNKDRDYFQYNKQRFNIFNITFDKSAKNHI